MRHPLTTLRQASTGLRAVIAGLRPTLHLSSAGSITEQFLVDRGYQLVIWDVDGTLMPYHATDLARAFREQLRKLFASGTARHAILSNCDEDRYAALARIFPEIPVVLGFESGGRVAIRIRQGGRETQSSCSPGARPGRMGRQVRKPNGLLVLQIMQELGVTAADRVLVVGDQYLTDIASARLAGVHSAKVVPLAPESFPVALRAYQHLEQLLYRCRYGGPAAAP